MVTSPMSKIIQHLRRVALLREGVELTDGQLLENFVLRRDAAALEVLVQRHASMVWGVCRRILQNHHDAEDAFQATFLVLVRKAASIMPREMVGNWLYGVAHQTALKARGTAAKRRAREKQVKSMPEPEAVQRQDHWPDIQPLLDEELSRLPDKYRVAIVLCDLEGKTRKEAARQLGVPDGTLAARLARARTMLAKRLARHGIAVSGGTLAALLSQKAASASVPTSVVSSTIKAVTLVAAGQAVTGSVTSVKVAALTEGVLKTMLLTKLKVAAVLLALFAAVIGGATALAFQKQAAERTEAAQPVQEQPVPEPIQEQPSGPPTWQIGSTLPGHGGTVDMVAFSPDGKWLAWVGNVHPFNYEDPAATPLGSGSVIIWDVAQRKVLHKLKFVEDKGKRGRSGPVVGWMAFAPDGKSLATSNGREIKLWDPQTGKEQATLKGHPMRYSGFAFSRDGKILVATAYHNDPEEADGNETELHFWDISAKKKLATLKFSIGVYEFILSPDRKRLVVAHAPPLKFWSEVGDFTNSGVRLLEIDDKFTVKKTSVLVDGRTCHFRVLPDGKTFFILTNHDSDTGRQDATELWDFETGKLLKSFENVGPSAAIAPDGKTLVTPTGKIIKKGGDSAEYEGGLNFWDVATLKKKQWLRVPGGVRGMAFSPDGKTVAVGQFHKGDVKLNERGNIPLSDKYNGGVVLFELKQGNEKQEK